MKRTTYFLIAFALILAGGFTSCEKVKSLLEITLTDVPFVINIDVQEISKKDSGVEFGGSGSFDPNDSPELAEYLDLVRNVEITEIKVRVTSATPATGLELSDAFFTLTDQANQASFTYNLPAAMDIVVGSEILIDSNTPNFSVVSDIISDMHAASVSLGGHVNQSGFILGFEYSIKANITVRVPEEK